jgi:hypothetical protein
MGFPKATNLGTVSGQDVQRMAPCVKGTMPITRLRGQGGGFGQKRTDRGGLIGQGMMGEAAFKAQAMPGEKRYGARAKPPSGIGAEPPAAPAG